MKVGDLVKFKGDTCESVGNPGYGTVIQYIVSKEESKKSTAEIHWPRHGFSWHLEEHLEVINNA